ncbi:MRO2B protein, partial [Anseranas semipalmata]|nr:MRO2B protein [Anseranas semipalmata]
QFLRKSLEAMEDEAWTERLSCELSQRLGSSASSSGEKSFLYKAVGTTLGACQRVPYVQEELLQHLQGANLEEPSEAQGVISLLCHAAEGHFSLVLDTLAMFAATLTKVQRFKVSRRQKVKCLGTSAQAARNAAMLAYSSLALRASKEQLLAHMETDIVGNTLLLFRTSGQDEQNKLALVQNITEVGCAIQAMGDSTSFDPSLKLKLVTTLRDFMKETRWDYPPPPVHLKVVLALEQWSKLRLDLSREETLSLLTQCCKSILPLPSAEEMEESTEMEALHMKSLQTSVKALGRLMAVLVETEPSPVCFRDIVNILWSSFFSSIDREHQRALQACAQLLAVYRDGSELQARRAYRQFGSLVGLLGPLTCDPKPTTRQLAATCLGSLLHIQGE